MRRLRGNDEKPKTEPLSTDRSQSTQRKKRDLAALLPIIGALFFISPFVSTLSPSEEANVTGTAIYIFSIWALLIICAFFLSRLLRTGKHDEIRDK
jgi:hypothetical protein